MRITPCGQTSTQSPPLVHAPGRASCAKDHSSFRHSRSPHASRQRAQPPQRLLSIHGRSFRGFAWAPSRAALPPRGVESDPRRRSRNPIDPTRTYEPPAPASARPEEVRVTWGVPWIRADASIGVAQSCPWASRSLAGSMNRWMEISRLRRRVLDQDRSRESGGWEMSAACLDGREPGEHGRASNLARILREHTHQTSQTGSCGSLSTPDGEEAPRVVPIRTGIGQAARG